MMSTQTDPRRQPPPKKLRATVDLDAPGIVNFEDVWTAPGISEKSLTTAESLFGDDRQWFVRPSYVKLYDDIMADKKRKHTQIVNGTAGVGKSSFLLYALARCRCAGKSVVLHYHRTDKEIAIAVFFPANSKPLLMNTSSPSYLETFRKWYKQIGIEESLFLVDGIVSFTKDDFPEGKVGVYGATFAFASEFVATRVAMALCLETKIKTDELLRCFERVGAAGGMRGVLFEAYAARRLAAGGKFPIKQVGSKNETILQLPTTTILQKDTKTLNQTHYPVQDIVDKIVWPNPSYMPAIDAFMLLLQLCIAFQMTVACSHGLDLPGTKAFLRYFDSMHRKLDPKRNVPQRYNLYFVVPKDTYEKFSAATQPITGPHGVLLDTIEATTIGGRVKQWIMKID